MTRRKVEIQQRSSQLPVSIPLNIEHSPETGLHSASTEEQFRPQHTPELAVAYRPKLVESMNPDPSATDSNDGDDKEEDDTFVIYTNLLIPGKGEPTKNRSVAIRSGKIIDIGSSIAFPPKYPKARSAYVPVLMPGLWDCHVHLMGTDSLGYTSFNLISPATAGARLARSVHDILMSGFTSVRDLGGYAPEIAKVVDEGTIPGPNIYSAGSALSQTAGHGDTFELPIGFVWSRCGIGYGTGNGDDVACRPLCVADGVDECRKAVRLMIRRGAKVIKVLASGGVLSRDDDPKLQQFSDEELKVIVEEAARMNRIVAAHVHGKAGIMAAIRAGCKTLEHGTYLDEEAVELMLKKDVMLIATRLIVIEGVKHKELLSPESYKKMLETAKYHKKAYGLAIKKGVKCALGTDLGTSVPGTSLSHGSAGAELLYAVEAGMTPLQAIEAATANGPATLGPTAPLSGQIKVGYDADLIGLAKNPIDNIGLFRDVKNITHVWKGGKLFKDTAIHPRPNKDNIETDPNPAHATVPAAAAVETTPPRAQASGKRALVLYDYEKANEIDLKEGEYVTKIEMVEEGWWTGENVHGEMGFFPRSYVELLEGDEGGSAIPHHTGPRG
jgi:imidazolonepropionase-like amidohydrolase